MPSDEQASGDGHGAGHGDGDDPRSAPDRGGGQERAFLESVPAFVLAFDAAGRITFWNRALEQATRFTRAEMLGQPGSGLVGAGGVRRLPIKGGGQLPVRWLCVPASAEGAQAPETYALGTDVSGEEELSRRTLRAERLAAVGRLAAGLAHEVRNPLNSAGLQLQVLRRRLLKAEGKAEVEPVLATIEQEIGRLERLISEFIAFAQPQPLALQRVRLGPLCHSVVAAIELEPRAEGLTFAVELDDDLPIVEVDPERLGQVLRNLLHNAVEASPPGGRIELHGRYAPGREHVEIEIADGGPGFSEDLPIFDAFFTTKPSATGLGLAVVHRIINDHGGTVHVRSQPGRTCFTVSLPIPGAG
jgi:signal transduction histidine kinase